MSWWKGSQLLFSTSLCPHSLPAGKTEWISEQKWLCIQEDGKVKTRFTGHRKLVGPGRKQGKLSCKVRIHNEEQKGLYAAPSPMAPDAHGAKSISVRQVSMSGPLFFSPLTSMSSSKSVLTSHSEIFLRCLVLTLLVAMTRFPCV